MEALFHLLRGYKSGENVLVVCCNDNSVVHTHADTHSHQVPLPIKTPTFLLIRLRVRGENGRGWLWGVWRGDWRRKCDLFSLWVGGQGVWWCLRHSGEDWFLWMLSQRPLVHFNFQLLDRIRISSMSSLLEETQLRTTRWAQNKKMTEC